ncbi:MAG TPA: lysine--tRNA ligase [Polyangiaceae bacterium]|nr:lysine--tRNA ligase [Polyangiaceae bacterium]
MKADDAQVAGDDDAAGGEAAIIQARRSKAERVRELGRNPFANDVNVADRSTLSALRERFAGALVEPPAELRYDGERVAALSDTAELHVLGRLMARRGFGKATFLRLKDDTGELQLFAKKDVLGEHFAALEDIDLADHVEAFGRAIVTKTGELTLEVSRIRLLTKALRPLPDKWHGLSDVDLRYRRRYVDLIANPEVHAVFRARSLISQGLRHFLDEQGFMEVETPTLHTLVGGAAARPFKTHHNTLDLELFLRIAPELYLKRLLVGGFERVYELGRCYRNEGISTRHNPEFTMLEFYQAYATYDTLMPFTESMLRAADAYLGRGMERAGLGELYAAWQEARTFTFEGPFARVPMHAAISRALENAGLSAEVMASLERIARAPAANVKKEGSPEQSEADALVAVWKQRSERAGRVDWPNLRRALGHCESAGERLFVAYEYLAEPFLADDYRNADGTCSVPVFIIDYPAEVSPLARRKDGHPELTDRFELFVHGRELCNAFSELNDPDDQAARFSEQVGKRERGAEETMDYDADYIRALEHGMPPAAGFGMGVDRLVMMLTGQPSIRDVIAFPLLRPETGAG